MRSLAVPRTWAERRATTWSWTKFLFLMMCVGAMPFTVDSPFPLMFAVAGVLATVTVISVMGSVLGQARHVPGLLRSRVPASPVAGPFGSQISVSLPTDPGVPGGALTRAPAQSGSVLG